MPNVTSPLSVMGQTLFCLEFWWFENLLKYFTFQIGTNASQTVYAISQSKLKKNQINLVVDDQN